MEDFHFYPPPSFDSIGLASEFLLLSGEPRNSDEGVLVVVGSLVEENNGDAGSVFPLAKADWIVFTVTD